MLRPLQGSSWCHLSLHVSAALHLESQAWHFAWTCPWVSSTPFLWVPTVPATAVRGVGSLDTAVSGLGAQGPGSSLLLFLVLHVQPTWTPAVTSASDLPLGSFSKAHSDLHPTGQSESLATLAVKESGKYELHSQVPVLTEAGTVTEDRGKLLGQEALGRVGHKVLPRSLSLFRWGHMGRVRPAACRTELLRA